MPIPIVTLVNVLIAFYTYEVLYVRPPLFLQFCGKFQDIIAVFCEARGSYGSKVST